MSERPNLEEMRAAASALRELLPPTPCVRSRTANGSVFLKLETCQPIGSFKLRGVYHAVASMSEERRSQGLSTVSAGNTAQALAWAGKRFGVPARSLMPDTAPAAKIEAVKRLGGEPVLVPTAEVFRFLREHLWEQEPFGFVHPWTDPAVACGHASLGLEILEDVPDVEAVYVPVGGGGLLAGVGAAIKAARPSVRVVAVEPEGCPSFHRSRAAGRPVEVECDTICDGVAVPYMTAEMFPILRELADDSILIAEEEVLSAVRRLVLDEKLVAEPSGALALAAALAENRDGPSVAIVTGASIGAHELAAILRARS